MTTRIFSVALQSELFALAVLSLLDTNFVLVAVFGILEGAVHSTIFPSRGLVTFSFPNPHSEACLFFLLQSCFSSVALPQNAPDSGLGGS